MKKHRVIILCMLIVSFTFAGCSTTEEIEDVDKLIMPTEASTDLDFIDNIKNKDRTFDFIIWNNSLDNQYIENAVSSTYPNAKLKIVSFDGADSDKLIKALASNEPIDMVTYYRENFGNFNSISGFEDLSQPKYDLESIKSLFSERELEHCKSFDDSKLLALPFPEFPMVTYYRVDILEKYGFPTDPEELGDYMSTLDNWLKIVKELKKHDIYAIQWNEELFQRALRCYAFYDDDMNLIVNNEKVRESLKATLEVNRLGLGGGYNVWGPDGAKAIKENKIAMMYINKWGENYLKGIVPEQAGKWRATRLPLNIYGYQSSSYASIVASSKYKTEAWEILKRYMYNDYNFINMQRENESEFLGGQKSMLLYEELINKIPLRYPTMLDDRDYSIFFDILYNNMDTKDADVIFNLAVSKINETTYREQKVLSEYLKENRKAKK